MIDAMSAEVEPAPKPSAGHDALQMWLGRWRAGGCVHGPDGSRAWLRSEESYELLPGGFFVLQRWSEHGQPEPFAGVGVLGYDEALDEYSCRRFENHGFYRRYVVRRFDRQWHFEGETERALYEFDCGGRRVDIRWEWRPLDQGEWRCLCERVALRMN
jgi:hypothetical protein